MSLRSSLIKLVSPLSSLWIGALAGVGLLTAAAPGCGDDSSLQCDAEGHCQICDAYGCKPANSNTGGGGSGTSSSTNTGGAPPTCDATKTTCPCDAKGQCSGGLQCVGGLCIDGCDFSYECGAGKVCADGACVPGCDAMKPCDKGYLCKNGACEPDPQNPECGPSNPCPAGQICGANGQCTTACTTNGDCASGEICDGSVDQCIPDPSPKPTCDANTTCPAPQICQTDGFCHYPCATVNECKLIDNRFVACDEGYCKTDVEVNPECTLDKPCPAGMSCISNECK